MKWRYVLGAIVCVLLVTGWHINEYYETPINIAEHLECDEVAAAAIQDALKEENFISFCTISYSVAVPRYAARRAWRKLIDYEAQHSVKLGSVSEQELERSLQGIK